MSPGFEFTPEQDALRTEVRRFLDEQAPIATLRRSIDVAPGAEVADVDGRLWDKLSRELGLLGVHIPESYGGQGLGFVELSIVLEEMGRSLVRAPYLASIGFAATAILEVATEAQKRALLPQLASGERIATLAWAEPSSAGADAAVWDGSRPGLCAQQRTDGSYRLDGVKAYVLDGASADLIVALGAAPAAAGELGCALFSMPAESAGLSRVAQTSIDPTRSLARIEFDGVRAERLGSAGSCEEAIRRIFARISIALACEMVGGAQRALEMAVDYAKERVQFGRPIGSFQAIKHKLADLLLELEPAKSAAYHAAAVAAASVSEVASHGACESASEIGAAEAVGATAVELGTAAAIAKALASDAYRTVSAENIQVHGGVGFTWEYDAQLYYKRALWSEAYWGDARQHRERYLRECGV